MDSGHCHDYGGIGGDEAVFTSDKAKGYEQRNKKRCDDCENKYRSIIKIETEEKFLIVFNKFAHVEISSLVLPCDGAKIDILAARDTA